MARPFIAWDGEGVTRSDGTHDYVMLANSLGEYYANVSGLSTIECFRALIDGSISAEIASNAKPIHIIYGGGYDANNWLRSLTRQQIRAIYTHDYYSIGSWRIQWRRGKSFYLKRGNSSVKIYDVMPFFQCPFIKACDSYLGTDYPDRDMMIENKALRSTFKEEDIPAIQAYNAAELRTLVMLMDEFRTRCNKVDIRLSRWDGPGAIAATLLSKRGIKHAISPENTRSEIKDAACFGYAGGRFEVIRCGDVEGKAYEYDVNSAYPSALRSVPNLRRGYWQTVIDPDDIRRDISERRFGLYHAIYRGPNSCAPIPAPLFRRHKNGAISYPLSAEGWYHLPDIVAASAYQASLGGTLEIDKAYVYYPDNESDKPFAFIDELYALRSALKLAGDGAHVGIKLGLNSLYGKLCQQIGARYQDGKWHIPPFHELLWAGYITASCRAQVLTAALQKPDSVIAFETDALFTSEPLDLKIGSELGDWESTTFNSLMYCQSGLYFGETERGISTDKTRGVDRGSLSRDACRNAMEYSRPERRVTASLTRFIGAGYAFQTSWDTWRSWVTAPKSLSVEPVTGKRWHIDCRHCEEGRLTPNVWHETFCPYMGHAANYAYPVLWHNPDPNMTELEERREEYAEYRGDIYD